MSRAVGGNQSNRRCYYCGINNVSKVSRRALIIESDSYRALLQARICSIFSGDQTLMRKSAEYLPANQGDEGA